MRNTLFDGIHEVTKEDVIEKMNYFMGIAEQCEQLYETDIRACIELARKLRSELEEEYKNNSLKRIQEAYRGNRLLSAYYSSAVHQALASITGKTTEKNVYSFLYDVKDYMRYHMPS